jgi:co-chaperonin GroES (HSP10)
MQEKQEKPQQSFIIPDDVVTKKKPHEVVKVDKISQDSRFSDILNSGDLIMVESHMLTEVVYNDEKYFLVSENAVLAKC